uniref:Uncharacterized protein n=1 Tax=Tanacetum cinerariifolium TaxID=118510 RepID=A0A699GXS5_TANCI|nr:hypothetical protein [Tanacetum cinerariifolium]
MFVCLFIHEVTTSIVTYLVDVLYEHLILQELSWRKRRMSQKKDMTLVVQKEEHASRDLVIINANGFFISGAKNINEISKKEHILKLKRRNMKITDRDIQYAVSIKEDTMNMCLHFTNDHEEIKINTPYPEKINTSYSSYRITSLEIFHEEFNRVSRIDDALFTYEVEISRLAKCDLHKEDYSEQQMSHETDDDEEIDTNVFDFETAMSRAFKEFNYLLQIDPNVLTKDIEVFKTYDEHKDDWIYEWNKDVPWIYKKPWNDTRRDDEYCNGGNLPGAYWKRTPLPRFRMVRCFENRELKEKVIKNKAIMEGMIDDDDESSNKCWRIWDVYEINNRNNEYENAHDDEERCELFDDHKLPVCTIRRFKIIKYSFGQDEEYVSVKDDEYEDLTSTSEDACRAYQEIFRKMDEGWMVTRAE